MWSWTTPLDPADWSLDRIDQKNLPLDGKAIDPKYNGSGVLVYVIDTGFNRTHPELNESTKISCGFDFFYDNVTSIDPPCHDVFGHGTMAASLVNGRYLGAAKEADVVSVRVGIKGPKDTTVASVLAGVEWVTSQKLLRHNRFRPTVAVMALRFYTGDYNNTNLVDIAVERMIAVGVTTIVGAGNEGDDACLYSPARVKTAITVSATDQYDMVWNYSNYGSCVDIFAPGVDVITPWRRNTPYMINSGTSQATALFGVLPRCTYNVVHVYYPREYGGISF
jgi:subtilisin family serine protease